MYQRTRIYTRNIQRLFAFALLAHLATREPVFSLPADREAVDDGLSVAKLLLRFGMSVRVIAKIENMRFSSI